MAGILSQGKPLVRSDEHVAVPRRSIDRNDVVYRVVDDLPQFGLASEDLLIVERRTNTAATGEFVIAALQGQTFVGRWWAKHGKRALMDDAFATIAEGPELVVLGAVTLILRQRP